MSGKIDLGFGELSEIELDNRITTQLVGEHELVLYCRAGHPLLDKRNLTKDDLDAYPLTASALPSRMARVFPGRSCLDIKSGHLIPSVEIESFSTARQVVAESDSISITSLPLIEYELLSGELGVVPYRISDSGLKYGFVYLADRDLPAVATEYMQLAREIEMESAERINALSREIFGTDQGFLTP